jgi:hypothetical protein
MPAVPVVTDLLSGPVLLALQQEYDVPVKDANAIAAEYGNDQMAFVVKLMLEKRDARTALSASRFARSGRKPTPFLISFTSPFILYLRIRLVILIRIAKQDVETLLDSAAD